HGPTILAGFRFALQARLTRRRPRPYQGPRGMNLKTLAKRSVPLVCAYYLLDGWRAARGLRGADIRTDSGRRHRSASVEESLAYVERVHRDYLRYAGIERFSGVVAEI